MDKERMQEIVTTQITAMLRDQRRELAGGTAITHISGMILGAHTVALALGLPIGKMIVEANNRLDAEAQERSERS